MRVAYVLAANAADLIGREVTIENWEPGHYDWGQGGILRAIEPEVVVESPVRHETFPLADFDTATTNGKFRISYEVPHELSECFEYEPGVYQGEVRAFSPNGQGYAPLRCGHHIDRRMERYRNSTERYAHSDVPPPGVSWDEWTGGED